MAAAGVHKLFEPSHASASTGFQVTLLGVGDLRDRYAPPKNRLWSGQEMNAVFGTSPHLKLVQEMHHVFVNGEASFVVAGLDRDENGGCYASG